MSVGTHRPDPCWEIVYALTGEHWPDEEGWPHFATRAEAAQRIAEEVLEEALNPWNDRPTPLLRTRQSFDGPCIKVTCDGCGEELDATGEGATHLGADWRDWFDAPDWREAADGTVWCEDCTHPWCHDCELHGHDEDDCPRDQPPPDPGLTPVPVGDDQLAMFGQPA